MDEQVTDEVAEIWRLWDLHIAPQLREQAARREAEWLAERAERWWWSHYRNKESAGS